MAPTTDMFLTRRGLALFMTVVAGCDHAGKRPPQAESPAVAVQLSSAHDENLDLLYRASGTIRGRTTAVLTSKTTGYVKAVDVRPGDRVRTGQVLAVLEANDSAASVRRARAGFDQSMESRAEAQNNLRAAQAALQIATTTHQRIKALHASHAVSQQELDEAEARLSGAVAQASMAEARVRGSASRIDQAKAEVGEAQATLDYARITAPFKGQVTERRIDPGNLASPGMPLLVVEEEGMLRVEAAVEESHAAEVAVGKTAVVEIDSIGRTVTGTVGEVVPTVDVTSRAFLVKVDLPGEIDGLRPGMFARVGFRVGTRARRVVPTTAISQNGAIDRVFAVDGDRLRLRMVTLGETQGPWTEVLSGLASGEKVVRSATVDLRDGSRFTELP